MADTTNTNNSNQPLFGLNIDPSARNLQLSYDLAQVADSSGIDFIAMQDHPYNANFLDTWTLLTALGTRTQHVRLLPDVLNLPLRPPALLAKQAATLDLLTNGRLDLGLGAGAYWEGVTAYGGSERAPAAAVDALEEAIHILRALWQTPTPDQAVTFAGQHYRLTNAHAGPAPAHSIGIWLGANRPRMLRLTGRLADGLLISTSYVAPENVLAVQQHIDDGAQQAGRNPLAIRRGYNLMGAIRRPGSLPMIARIRGSIVGTPAHWIDEILRYYSELRLDTFIFWPIGGDALTQAHMFAEEVVPVVISNIL